MIKNLSLLLAILLVSYLVIDLFEKWFKGNKFKVFARSFAVIIVLIATGILSAAGLILTISEMSLKVGVLVFSLGTAAYFCYYPESSKRTQLVWITIISAFSAFCISGFYQSFNQDNTLIFFYMYLVLGLGAGFVLYLLIVIANKSRALYGQSLAFILSSFSIFLLMESDWNKGQDTIISPTLAQQPDTLLWTALVFILLSFTCGLFFTSKNNTSC